MDKKIALLKKLIKTTTAKDSSPLKWEFEESHFGIYGFKAVRKGMVYSCIFDPAEGYSLSIYENGHELPPGITIIKQDQTQMSGPETLSISGLCYKSYFDKLFEKAAAQLPEKMTKYRNRQEKKRQESIATAEQKRKEESKQVDKALRHLSSV